MRFAEPLFFWGLLILPLLVVLFIVTWRKKQRFMERFASKIMMKQIASPASPGRRMFKLMLSLMVGFFLVLALVRPQWGQKLELVQRKGLDIMLVQDVSLSMLAEDIKPNRLTRAKHEISDFLTRLIGDRVGLVAFAGEAQLLCPLTLDYSTARIFLNELQTDWLMPGTNVADGINTGLQAFARGKSGRQYQVMVLLSDGEEHDDNAIKAAEAAMQAGVTIYTVGIGSKDGVPILLSEQEQQRTGEKYKKDRRGSIVTTRLEESTLQKIAMITGGKYYHAQPGDFELQKILQDITDRERREMEGEHLEQFQERYQIPLLIAMILLMLDTLLADRRIRKVSTERFV
jgi:Ca-activated chloride channel homolog